METSKASKNGAGVEEFLHHSMFTLLPVLSVGLEELAPVFQPVVDGRPGYTVHLFQDSLSGGTVKVTKALCAIAIRFREEGSDGKERQKERHTNSVKEEKHKTGRWGCREICGDTQRRECAVGYRET